MTPLKLVIVPKTIKATIKRKNYHKLKFANLSKWSNTLKQFAENLLTNCFNVFHHFVRLVQKSAKLFDLFENLFEIKQYIFFFKFKLMKTTCF